ncbi:hypothetical protein D3C79_826510 [compost metagenome]
MATSIALSAIAAGRATCCSMVAKSHRRCFSRPTLVLAATALPWCQPPVMSALSNPRLVIILAVLPAGGRWETVTMASRRWLPKCWKIDLMLVSRTQCMTLSPPGWFITFTIPARAQGCAITKSCRITKCCGWTPPISVRFCSSCASSMGMTIGR